MISNRLMTQWKRTPLFVASLTTLFLLAAPGGAYAIGWSSHVETAEHPDGAARAAEVQAFHQSGQIDAQVSQLGLSRPAIRAVAEGFTHDPDNFKTLKELFASA